MDFLVSDFGGGGGKYRLSSIFKAESEEDSALTALTPEDRKNGWWQHAEASYGHWTERLKPMVFPSFATFRNCFTIGSRILHMFLDVFRKCSTEITIKGICDTHWTTIQTMVEKELSSRSTVAHCRKLINEDELRSLLNPSGHTRQEQKPTTRGTFTDGSEADESEDGSKGCYSDSEGGISPPHSGVKTKNSTNKGSKTVVHPVTPPRKTRNRSSRGKNAPRGKRKGRPSTVSHSPVPKKKVKKGWAKREERKIRLAKLRGDHPVQKTPRCPIRISCSHYI